MSINHLVWGLGVLTFGGLLTLGLVVGRISAARGIYFSRKDEPRGFWFTAALLAGGALGCVYQMLKS